MVLLLSKSDIEEILTMEATIDAVEEAMGKQEGSLVPDRIQLKEHENGEIFVMPGSFDRQSEIGLKVVNIFPENDQKGLPRTLSTMSLYSSETGELDTLLDGTHITNYRTGAIGAVAARYLAPPDVESIGIFGSSTQARYQARALDTELDPDLIRLYSRSEMKYDAVTELQPELDCRVEAVESSQACCAGSDIVVTATTSPQPVFEDADLEAGTLVISVGSNDESMREIPGKTMARAAEIYVDNYDGCLTTGDIAGAIKEDQITETDVTSVHDLVMHSPPYRNSQEEIYVVKSIGTIVYDIGVSQYVLGRATEEGRGQRVPRPGQG
jgi:ornithine cyclodeaminase/alanine dehydrogenase-like protein (mu-crystallin family)